MQKAILKPSGITVFIHEDLKPNMRYNKNKVVVSKQESAKYIFAVNKENLEFIK